MLVLLSLRWRIGRDDWWDSRMQCCCPPRLRRLVVSSVKLGGDPFVGDIKVQFAIFACPAVPLFLRKLPVGLPRSLGNRPFIGFHRLFRQSGFRLGSHDRFVVRVLVHFPGRNPRGVHRGQGQRHRPLRGIDSSDVGLFVGVVVVSTSAAHDFPRLMLEQAFPSAMDAACVCRFLR